MKFMRTALLTAATLVLVVAHAGAAELTLSFTNLMPLDESTDGLYEGWAIIDGAPVSTGVFNVNASGQPVMPGGGGVIPSFMTGDEIGLASSIKISLEPVGDADPAPRGRRAAGDAYGALAAEFPRHRDRNHICGRKEYSGTTHTRSWRRFSRAHCSGTDWFQHHYF